MEISVVSATKYIRNALILDNINIHLQSGMIYGLQGPNGSGKTMFLRLLSGLIYPTTGSVLVNGKELGKDIDFPESLGLLLENPAFLPNYDGFHNLETLSKIRNSISSDNIRETIRTVGLNPDDPRKFKKYSLGMKQRLGIAAALMERPELLLLDEPTNALDADGVELVCNLILEEKQRGTLVVLSCHDANILERLADEILVVHSGQITVREKK